MGTLLGLKEQNKLGMVLFFHFVVLWVLTALLVEARLFQSCGNDRLGNPDMAFISKFSGGFC